MSHSNRYKSFYNIVMKTKLTLSLGTKAGAFSIYNFISRTQPFLDRNVC